jgi:hypothetical protein
MFEKGVTETRIILAFNYVFSDYVYMLYSLAQDQSTRGGARVEESGEDGE